MSSEKRIYTLKARARRQAETRERIVAATSELHREVGPARTTIAEIARRAGVQRLTVYNNFPDERELFAECSAHWLARNPLPDPSPAFALSDPDEMLGAVLRGLYGYYRKTEAMAFNIQRDRLVMPALDAVVTAGADAQLAVLANALTAGFKPSARNRVGVHAAVALALDFWTWRRLKQEGLSDDSSADLMLASVKAAAGS
ncbi:MAG: TetR/AcrR family transcriptional regulator [Candidatus Dormiibacterota bacterium]